MRKYNLLSPMVDIIFKALFGGEDKESKIILIDFLNAVMNLSGENEIVDVIEMNPYNDRKYRDDKLSIMDLKVKTDKDELIDIEVQINQRMNFRKRSLFYWSKLYGETLKDGEDYDKLKKCVVISLLDFDLIYETDKYHTVFRIKETEDNFELLDDLEIHYLEVKKFFEDTEYKTELERWIIFMKAAGDEKKESLIERIRSESEVIDMAVKKLEVLSQDEKQRQEYLARQKAIRDEISRKNYAENLAKEMHEKGIKEGIKEEKVRMAKQLLTLGINLEIVKQSSGLSEEEIDKLKEEIQKEHN